MRALMVGGVAVALALVAAVPASAADPWVSPVTLSDAAGSLPQVAMNERGDAVAAWTGPNFQGVHVAQAAPSSGFGAETRIADGTRPKVAMAPDGTAIIAWQGISNGALMVATRTAAGALSEPQQLSVDNWAPYGEVGGDLDIGVVAGPDGTILVAWVERDAPTPGPRNPLRVRVAWRPPGAPRFGEPQTVAGFNVGRWGVEATVDGSGRATLAWLAARPEETDTDAVQRVWVTEGDVVSGFSPPVELTSDEYPADPLDEVVLDGNADGDRVIASATPLAQRRGLVVREARTRGADWGPRQTFVGGDGLASHPSIDVDPAGNATVAWSDGYAVTYFSYRPAAGVFGPQIPPNPGVQDEVPYQLAGIDSRGRAVIMWSQPPAKFDVEPIRTARYTHGIGLEPVFDISGNPGSKNVAPDIAFDGLGNGVVVWEGSVSAEQDDGTYVLTRPIRMAFYDTAPPISQYIEQDVEQYIESGGHRGRTLKYRLSEPADVKLSIQRARRCASKKKGCIRYVAVRRTTDSGRRGTNRLTLPRKVVKADGLYRVVLSASDRAGNRRTKSLKVRVR